MQLKTNANVGIISAGYVNSRDAQILERADTDSDGWIVDYGADLLIYFFKFIIVIIHYNSVDLNLCM